jgi:Redoxin
MGASDMTTTIRAGLFRIRRVMLGAILIWAGATALAATGMPGAAAPDFALRTVDGRNLRRQEMPHLNRLYEKYRASGFVLLGVNVDEDTRAAAGVASKLGVTFPVLPDSDKAVSRLYDLRAMPSTVLIDRDGRVRYLHRGYLAGYEDTYDKQIRELLKE